MVKGSGSVEPDSSSLSSDHTQQNGICAAHDARDACCTVRSPDNSSTEHATSNGHDKEAEDSSNPTSWHRAGSDDSLLSWTASSDDDNAVPHEPRRIVRTNSAAFLHACNVGGGGGGGGGFERGPKGSNEPTSGLERPASQDVKPIPTMSYSIRKSIFPLQYSLICPIQC